MMTPLAYLALYQQRPGDAVVAQLEAQKPPALDQTKIDQPEYRQQYVTEQTSYLNRRAELIMNLVRVDAKHPRAPEFFENRWQLFLPSGEVSMAEFRVQKLKAIDGFLLEKPGEPFREITMAARQEILIEQRDGTELDPTEPAFSFVTDYPNSPRAARLLFVSGFVADPPQRKLAYTKFLEKFPNHRMVPSVKESLELLNNVGKPGSLEFDDINSGRKVSLAGLKGKVVVVDFWTSSWNVYFNELPTLKETYALVAPKGAEFIGINLDLGDGAEPAAAVKKLINETGISWPQQFTGKGMNDAFPKSLNVKSLPCRLVYDKKGMLRTVNPSNLRSTLNKLLAEK
jgi:hypothetical protein